jgi:hypothetical protein
MLNGGFGNMIAPDYFAFVPLLVGSAEVASLFSNAEILASTDGLPG